MPNDEMIETREEGEAYLKKLQSAWNKRSGRDDLNALTFTELTDVYHNHVQRMKEDAQKIGFSVVSIEVDAVRGRVEKELVDFLLEQKSFLQVHNRGKGAINNIMLGIDCSLNLLSKQAEVIQAYDEFLGLVAWKALFYDGKASIEFKELEELKKEFSEFKKQFKQDSAKSGLSEIEEELKRIEENP